MSVITECKQSVEVHEAIIFWEGQSACGGRSVKKVIGKVNFPPVSENFHFILQKVKVKSEK